LEGQFKKRHIHALNHKRKYILITINYLFNQVTYSWLWPAVLFPSTAQFIAKIPGALPLLPSRKSALKSIAVHPAYDAYPRRQDSKKPSTENA